MYELLPITELLFSCWIISGEEEASETLPTAPGVLDYALRDVVKSEAFPEWARKQLHFVHGKMGMRCLELKRIQQLATHAKLTSEPNPSYTHSEVVVGKSVALRCLDRLEVSENEAKTWGKELRQAVAKWEEKILAPESA